MPSGASSWISAQTPAALAQIPVLLDSARRQMDTSTASAFILIAKLKQLCAQAKVDSLSAKVLTEEGYCNFYSGNYKKAVLAFDSAAMIWKSIDQLSYAKALNNVGTAFMYNSEYYRSLISFFDALKISERIGNTRLTGQVLNNIGLVYESIGDWDNALLYGKKALGYKLLANDTASIGNSYGNIGNIFSLKQVTDSAIYYQWRSYFIDSLIGNRQGMSNALGNIGNAYRKIGLTDSAIAYLSRGIAISRTLGNAENNANFLNNIAESYLRKGDLKNAEHYALEANAYVPHITDNEFLQDNYRVMYEYYKQTHHIAKAFEYLDKLSAVNDSIFRQKINIQNEKLAVDYEYKQKALQDSLVFQSQINATEKKVTATHNRLVITLLLLLLAAAFSAIWYTRSKFLQKKNIVAQQNAVLQEQKIRELENERQMLASKSVLQGQEEERSRLAKDLHDGLGGFLSGVKHSIIHAQENITMQHNHAGAFEKPLNMIDTAMRELRRVAQNMMPEALSRFGLEEALRDYCAGACTASVKVIFQSFGKSVKIDGAVEIIIYRIIQELVHNAVKHAGATQVMVQLVQDEDWLSLSVEDNGKGFDTASLKQSPGSGWCNIRSRVDYLKGNIDLKSQEGMGTSVNIDIKNLRS